MGGIIQLSRDPVQGSQFRAPDLRAVDAVGEQKTIVILVEFPDIKNTFSREYVHRQIFVELNQYIKNVSYGKTWLTGDTTKKWYRLPMKAGDYGIGSEGEQNWFTGNVLAYFAPMIRLVQDAVDLADSDVDFSRYRRTIIVLGTGVMQKWYAFGGGAAAGFLVGLEWKTPSGKSVRGAHWVAAGAHLGMYAHEFLHQIGGYEGGVYKTSIDELLRYRRVVIDLYDLKAYMTRGDWHGMFQYYPRFVGPWDIMGFHTVNPDKPPAGPSSFTKLRLGWIAESQVVKVKPGDVLSVRLDPLELLTSGIHVVKIPLTSDTYYLIENRQQVGYDSVLPSSGVLVYYVDETIREGRGTVKLVDANPKISELGGAAFDVGPSRNSTFVDKPNGWALRLEGKPAEYYTIQIDATKLVTTATTTMRPANTTTTITITKPIATTKTTQEEILELVGVLVVAVAVVGVYWLKKKRRSGPEI